MSIRPHDLTPRLTVMILITSLIGICLNTAHADDTSFEATRLKLTNALQQDYRSKENRDRDANRRPIETLEFFGFREDMHVLELFPGGGWYTELLAPTLAERGQLYLWFYAEDTQQQLLKRRDRKMKAAIKAANILPFDPETILSKGPYYHNQYPIAIPAFTLGADDLDMVLNIRTQHLFDGTGRQALNKAVFDALKPDGIYGIVGHVRRHMQSDYAENWRRLDPVVVIKEALEAGFDFDSYSDLHHHPDDELRYDVGRKTVAGHTDRYTLKFRKPISSP